MQGFKIYTITSESDSLYLQLMEKKAAAHSYEIIFASWYDLEEKKYVYFGWKSPRSFFL